MLFQQGFKGIGSLAVALLEGVGVDVHGSGGLRMAETFGYGLHVLLAGNQECG